MSVRLLIVDDEKIALKNLEHVMRKEGYEVTATQSGSTALGLLAQRRFDVVLTDLRMEKVDGLQILASCRERHPDCEVIVITGYATTESAVAAMSQGAYYYIAKPFRLEEVRKVVAEAVEKVRLKREVHALRERVDSYEGRIHIVTQDERMRQQLDTARQVAPTDCNVLICGETGTGKELFAKYLHLASKRSEGPYLAINCGAFSEELLANELFGHDKGAYTGAVNERHGLIEAASGGTLFLDEITEMSAAMQVKLLRVLQERELLRLGSTQPIKVDVRFIAASNRDVQQAVRDGVLRQDIYFRLNVVMLQIPPLVARTGDVPLLCVHFIKKFAALMNKNVQDISAEALDILSAYDFPGNVRELENVIERGVALAGGHSIEVSHLPDDLRDYRLRTFRRKDNRIQPLEEMERDYIRWVLRESGSNQLLAAQQLGIDRVTLWRKLKKYEPE